MSIEVNGLRKFYGEQAAVDGITFSVGRGEIVGFLGPNGAGKSTTMKMLTGYIPPDEGTALVAGLDVVGDPAGVRRRTGYLPESNPLYGEMYVREYLTFIAGLNGLRRPAARIAELLERTGLGPESHKPIGALSKGYKQRVGLAQAMMADPDVLILDEPTSGLDPNQLVGIRRLIRELGREKTVLFSTHIMQEVAHVCDRVLIISKGRLVADGPVAELSGGQGGQCLVEVEFESPVDPAVLQALPLDISENQGNRRLVFAAPTVAEVGRAVGRLATETGNAVVHLNRVSRDLETVFRELTSQEKP